MLGRRQLTPGWEDDPVWNKDGIRQLGRWDIGCQEERVGWVQ